MRPFPSAAFLPLLLMACSATGVGDGTAMPVDAAAPLGETATPRSTPRTAVPASTLRSDASARSLLTAAIAVHEHQRRVAIENLANVDTCGFKRRVAVTSTQPITAADGQVHLAPTVLGSTPVIQVGAIETTGRTLDVAIDGDGFFAVQQLDGSTRYTRDGRFGTNADSKLVTMSGRVVLPEITFPQDTLDTTIAPDGSITVRTAGSPDTTCLLGTLTLHRFVNPAGLRPEGNLLAPNEASGNPITNNPGTTGLGLLRQRCLERSTVQTGQELQALRTAEQHLQSLYVALEQCGVDWP